MGNTSLHNRTDHRYAAGNLSAYLDGQLSATEAQRVGVHVRACAECQRELATLRATVALVGRAPMRAVPRSFALPLSAQPQQARARRWNATHAFMRGGMVAVAAMLMLTIGVDVVFRAGVIPLPAASAPVASAPDYGEPDAGVVATAVVESAVERQAEGAGGEPLLGAPAEGVGIAAAAAPSLAASPSADSVVGIATVESTQGPESIAEKAAQAPMVESSPTAEMMAAQAETTAAPTQELRAMAPAGTTAEAIATPESAAHEAEPTAAPSEQAPAKLAPAWIAWQAARTLLGILVGLFLILAAGLLWSGFKRRA